MIAADGRAFESLQVAERMRDKADNIRKVRVKGDAERKREAEGEHLRPLLTVGARVSSPIWGLGTVVKINQKTVKMAIDRLGGKAYNEPIEWLTIIAESPATTPA